MVLVDRRNDGSCGPVLVKPILVLLGLESVNTAKYSMMPS